MAATSVLKLKVEDKEYNSSLRQAQQGMQHLEQALQAAGKTFNKVDKSVVEYARGIGQMEAQSKTARGRIGEMTSAFVELSTQYNKMSADVQKSDVGKALSQSIDQLRQRTIAAKQELEGLNRQLANTKTPDIGSTSGGFLSGLGGKMEGALAVFGGNLMTKAAGAVANLGAEMYGMVQQGIEMAKAGEGIRIAFERLGRGDILDGLREATHGTVTDIELMKAAVKFNDFKLPLDELGTMLAFAQQKAKDTGQSVDYMVDSIVTGLGRKSLMILDNLGLSATEIKDKMAETGDMTKAVGAIIREQMAKAGDYVETAADRAAQANVSLQNKMEELGRKFAPLQEASNTFWTSVKISILDVVGGPLADFLNGLTEAGRRMGMLKQMNGGGDGGNTKVENQLSALRGSNYKNAKYNSQIAQYDQDIRDAERLRKKYQDTGWAGGGLVLSEISRRFNVKIGSKEDIDNLISSLKTMRSEYVQGAKEIMKPVKPVIDTSGAEQSIDSLKGKLAELEAQRKKAIAAGDTDLSKNLAKQIAQTKADIKGLGGIITTTSTAATPKTEEQQNADRIAELVKQYQDLATAAKTANDAQKAGLTERMTKIQGEITTLQERNTELKKFADEAKQVQYPVGSLPQLNEQLKTLQTEQAKALDAKQWQDYQRQIEQTQYHIDALKGKWKDGLQATFKLNIKQQGSTDINTAKPDDIAVTFKADDADVLEKLRDIEGVSIDPKTLTVTAQTQEAIAALQRVDGLTLQPKAAEVTFKADDSDVLAKVRDIEGLAIDPKTLTVTAETSEAIAALQRVDGLTLQPKTAEVTFRVDNSDVLAKVRDIEGVTIDPKTLTVTAQTQDAIAALQRVDGMTLQPKAAEVTFKADDADVLEKLRDIEGVAIDPKTLTVTAETQEAIDKLRGIEGMKIDPKGVTVMAKTSDALDKLHGIAGVQIDPKTLTVTANTAEAYNQVQQLLKSVDKKTVTFTVQPKMETGVSITNDAGMSAYIASIKQQLETADYGTSLYNGLSAQLSDMTTLQNLVGASLKAGLSTAMFDAADATGKDFWTRAMEGSVENTDWQAIIEKINEALKAAGLDTISLNFKTGEVSSDKSTKKGKKGNPFIETDENGKETVNLSKAVNGMADGISKVVGGVEQLGIKIPDGLKNVLGGIQTVTTIISGIDSTVLAISAIASADAIIPFARGGIVGRAAGGLLIPGNSMSGDRLRLPVSGGGMIGVNSGELILNRSQQDSIAAQLEGGMRNIELTSVVRGEDIVLAINNRSRRMWRGEYVTSKKL